MIESDLIRRALLIRRFEEKLLELYAEGKIDGTVHTCIGQEWVGIAAANASVSDDYFLSSHRGHGHFLARFEKPVELFAEVMGRNIGVSGGKGGSQHLWGPNFISNGIQGGMVPVAAGIAQAFRLNNQRNLAVVFIGDGTLGQGPLYESLNMASKWSLPLVVVVENNGIAQTTPTALTIAGSVESRAKCFGIDFIKANTRDWKTLLKLFQDGFARSREKVRPLVIEVETFRLKPHSKGDDTRPGAEISQYESLDPLNALLLSDPALTQLDLAVRQVIEQAAKTALEAPIGALKPKEPGQKNLWGSHTDRSERYVTLLNEGIADCMRRDERVLFIGEDVMSPYGGAFKAAKNLSVEFPQRVITTPISEPGITGLGTGLALCGLVPLVEIMFGDFLALGFDQILNHACKFAYMYDNKVSVPLVVRTPMGGYRGYGPTHSQSLEKHFQGIPGLTVAALNIRSCPKRFYQTLVETINHPHLVVENKVLYTKFLRVEPIAGYQIAFSNERFPTVRIRPTKGQPDVTIFCYGGMLEMAEDALVNIFEQHEVLCEIICPTVISPLNIEPLLESVRVTNRLMTIEEGVSSGGIGAEAAAAVMERVSGKVALTRIGCQDFIPASSVLEQQLLPNVEKIVSAMGELIRG